MNMQDCRRPQPPFTGTEKEMLLGFLNYQRGTIACKIEGLTMEQAQQQLMPSTLTLASIVRHLTWVEPIWFRGSFLGEDLVAAGIPDALSESWTVPEGMSVTTLVAAYREEIERSNEIIRTHDLDEIARKPRRNRPPMQLRWILAHMIEETARHAGHMDLIRESIDGETGE